jgi:cell division protease FtsH
MMGSERRSLAMNEEEKKLTAYHEAGHAVVALHCPNSDPIHKATIVPRGGALGMVIRLPEGDRYSTSRAKLYDDLAVAMGGRVAEELTFGLDNVTTGASGDIQMATRIARKMVSEWGLSDAVGTINYSGSHDKGWQGTDVSEATAQLLDAEVKRIVGEGLERARQLLKEHSGQLETLAQALLEHETLSGDEITDVLAGKPLDRASTGTPIKRKKTSSLPSSKAVPA